MSLSKDDPRLVAYALGELGEAEAKELEAEIADNAELLAEIEAIRDLGGLLREGLGSKKTPALTEAQKKEVEKEVSGPAKPAPIPLRKRVFRVAAFSLGAAAALAAASTLVVFPRMQREREREVSFIAAQQQQAQEEKARLEAQIKDQQQRVDSLNGQLAGARDEATRQQLMAQLQQEQGKQKMSAGGGKGAPGRPDPEPQLAPNTESYAAFQENPFIDVATDPRSTFSIDVDTASYSIVRRYIEAQQRPPPGAVRIEELVNYFPYDDPSPQGGAPFAVRAEVAAAPWTPKHRLVRIGLKGRQIDQQNRPGTNLVFLLDVSGSMDAPNKLPLLKRSFGMLVSQLDDRDRVSIVVYAGASGLVLPPTSGAEKTKILSALQELRPGGSTNGAAGIELAYAMAEKTFIPGGQNRVVLATDGDFNVGLADRSSLVEVIKAKAKNGVFLSVLGFGMGNYKDDTLESLAQNGNGNYAYIDNAAEAKKVLVQQMTGTLLTIAKDVKIQVEWNPQLVKSARLIGYENRILAHRDFNDDKKDAGDIGAGHSVTALYEVIPAGQASGGPGTDPLKYQKPGEATQAAQSGELFTVKLRFKPPNGDTSEMLELPVVDNGKTFADASTDLKFAASVAAFGMVLRKSPHKGSATMSDVIEIAGSSLGEDPGGYRRDFVALARQAVNLPENINPSDMKDPWALPRGKCAPGDPLCSEL